MIRMTKRKKRKKTTKHFLPQKHSQSIDFFFFIFHICEKIKFLHKNVSSLWRCVSAFLFFFTWEFRFGLRCDKSEVFEEEERRKWHLQTKLNRKEMRTRMKRLDCQTININRLWRDIKKQFPVLNSLQMKEDDGVDEGVISATKKLKSEIFRSSEIVSMFPVWNQSKLSISNEFSVRTMAVTKK